jgi:hypothetical protein
MKTPSWFTGELYEKGSIVKNPYSGMQFELNALELSIYDYVLGLNTIIQEMGGVMDPRTVKFQGEMAKGISWFRNNNAKAYMILLD